MKTTNLNLDILPDGDQVIRLDLKSLAISVASP